MSANLEDIIGIESVKLGFYKELQRKICELETSNIELNQKRLDVQAILDGIPDVMAVIGYDFRVMSVNNAFYEIYGQDSPRGRRCHEVFKGQPIPCSQCPLVTIREGPARVSRNLQIMNIGGHNRQIECTASLMGSADGKPNKILIFQRDVTMEKQYEAKYLQAERMATIGILAEGVAHEINNPLTSIGGFAEALTRRMDGMKVLLKGQSDAKDMLDDFDEYLQIILKECNRCSEIVQNLLTFGHKRINNMTIVNLNDIVCNSLKLLKPKLSQLPEDIISINFGERTPFVLGHAGELMQVMLNLILNALYAVQDSGKIVISADVDNDLAILKVADTGHGISQEHIGKLFEPFFTTKPPGQGIGIGLSTCYNIISKHFGEINVEGRCGQGATFEIVLPYLAD